MSQKPDALDVLGWIAGLFVIALLALVIFALVGCSAKRVTGGCVAEAKVECPPCTCVEHKEAK